MHLARRLSPLALYTSAALAALAQVHNHCPFGVWLTSVQTHAGPTTPIAPGALYIEAQRPTEHAIGVSLQISTSATGAADGAPLLILAYAWSNDTGLYYSLSTVNGFAFQGQTLRVHGTEGKAVGEIVWHGVPGSQETVAYLEGEADVVLELCDGGA